MARPLSPAAQSEREEEKKKETKDATARPLPRGEKDANQKKGENQARACVAFFFFARARFSFIDGIHGPQREAGKKARVPGRHAIPFSARLFFTNAIMSDTMTRKESVVDGPASDIPPPRVAVVGGRDFSAYDALERCLDAVADERGGIAAIVSGGARGADSLAADYARARGIALVEFKPDYALCRTLQERRRAPLLRNADIVAAADMVVAFWDGHSRGTADSIARARRAGLPRRIYDYAGHPRSSEPAPPIASLALTANPWMIASGPRDR